MKVYIEPKFTKNIIATIAIGEKYLNSWEANALPGWRKYCERHNLGLVVFSQDLVSVDHAQWKKPTWQKMLIGDAVKKLPFAVDNVCYLDTDILVNHTAPNIFDYYNQETIGLVSKRENLPFPHDEVLRRIAFLRHSYYDQSYPLDSALFISLEKLYGYHGLKVQSDEACMGLIVFNVNNHSDLMRSWFGKYDKNVKSITNGGDQTHANYEIQNWGKVTWLDYRFQALWPYEMAWKYPFLYSVFRDDQELVRECIEASLYSNYFLHFAGSWHESDMWKIGGIFEDELSRQALEKYASYLQIPVTGEPQGMIRPKQ